MDISVSLLNVVAVLLDGMTQAANVVVGMIAHAVSFVQNLLKEFGIFTHVVTYDEERSLDSLCPQYFKNKRGGFGNRAVVERQVDCSFATVHSP
jgi:hypothetical protein